MLLSEKFLWHKKNGHGFSKTRGRSAAVTFRLLNQNTPGTGRRRLATTSQRIGAIFLCAHVVFMGAKLGGELFLVNKMTHPCGKMIHCGVGPGG